MDPDARFLEKTASIKGQVYSEPYAANIYGRGLCNQYPLIDVAQICNSTQRPPFRNGNIARDVRMVSLRDGVHWDRWRQLANTPVLLLPLAQP